MKIKKIVLTTTLYRLRKHHACEGRYNHLVAALGEGWGDKKSINLLDILKHNGPADCLWAFCAVVKHPDGDKVMRLMAADFAEAVLPIYEKDYPNDDRPRKAIKAARDYANGKITSAARSAALAAWSAAESAASAAWSAARLAARSAALAALAALAARSAAESAAESAASAAESAARLAAESAQSEIIKKYLAATK